MKKTFKMVERRVWVDGKEVDPSSPEASSFLEDKDQNGTPDFVDNLFSSDPEKITDFLREKMGMDIPQSSALPRERERFYSQNPTRRSVEEPRGSHGKTLLIVVLLLVIAGLLAAQFGYLPQF